MTQSILSASTVAGKLHEANARLDFWLRSLTDASTQEASKTHVATPEEMSGLLSELMRVGTYLRSLPERSDSALLDEIAEYRKHVERLRDLLPSIHAGLLQERARLECERLRIESAAAWASRSQETL
jgi:hypothetical protein